MVETRRISFASKRFCCSSSPEASSSPRPSKRSKVKIDAAAASLEPAVMYFWDLILDNCDVSASQEIYLQRCGFAVHGQPPPDSDPLNGISPPPLNDNVVASHRASDDSETDSVIDSGYDVVDREAIRLVYVEESSTDTIVLEDDEADSTVGILAEKRNDVFMESSGNRRDEGKKLKIPLRDVVKAIVMNSKNQEEEKNKEIEKMSFVQVLMNKGFKF